MAPRSASAHRTDEGWIREGGASCGVKTIMVLVEKESLGDDVRGCSHARRGRRGERLLGSELTSSLTRVQLECRGGARRLRGYLWPEDFGTRWPR